MTQEFTLHIQSTGELIAKQKSKYSLLSWQRKTEKKLLRSGNRAERFKDAIRAGDTIAGWSSDSFQELMRCSQEVIDAEYKRVMRGHVNYD